MSDRPRFSVVVASFRDPALLTQCLGSLRPQCAEFGAELVVVRAGNDAAKVPAEVWNRCRLLTAPSKADVPRLRGIGLAAAGGEWAALTEDHCVADPGWLSALVAAAQSGAEVLGGSMGNAQRKRTIDRGAFFSEYGFFGANGLGDVAGTLPLITGANVAYHRSVLAEVTAMATAGMWENEIHERLHAGGRRFHLVPAARIRQNQNYRLGAFCRDRFEHGRDYAVTRAGSLPGWRRGLLLAATPVLPLVLASRVARTVDPEERPYFRSSLPATLTFFAAWSAGEAAGYLRGRRGS